MTVTYSNGMFRIDEHDVFLYGGEFHYFRVPRSEWRQRLDRLKEAGCNLVSTYVPWVWHEREEGQFDFTGETSEGRDLKGFLQLVREYGFYCIVRPGPYVMAEVRYEGVPPWLLERYPEVMARKRDGTLHPTKVVSYLHPTFLKKVELWYRAVNRIIAPQQQTEGGPVIMYQLCNEVGMLHWVTNTSDYQMDTLNRFSSYLKCRYDNEEAFSHAIGRTVTSFVAVAEALGHGLDAEWPSLHVEWGEFWRDYIREYIDTLSKFARNTGIQVPFIINVHGFKDYSIYSRGVDYPIGLSQLYRTAEVGDAVIAGDFYPGHIGYDNYHDLILACTFTRAVSPEGQPLFSAEFQSGRLADRPRLYPHDLDLNTRTCVAHGMNALNYYMFIAGENAENIGLFGRRHEWQAPVDSVGGIRPNYDKAAHLGKLFETIGACLLHAPKVVQTWIGFNPNDYMTETVDSRDLVLLREPISKREHFAFDGVYRLLAAANIHYEAVDLLKRISPSESPTLWVFSSTVMEEEVQRRLADYVEAGGMLVLFPDIPVQDRSGKPCTILKERLDLGEWETINGVDYVDVLDIDSVNVRQRLNFSRYEGEVLASFTRGEKSETAAYLKQCGGGQIAVLGIAIGHDYAYHLEVIRALAQRFGIATQLECDNPDLSVVERKGEKGRFLFVTNYDEIVQTGAIQDNGHPLFDGQRITLQPRSGLVCTLDMELIGGLMLDYATVELTGIRNEKGQLELDVTPMETDGCLKLSASSDWILQGYQKNDEGVYRIKGIDSPLTLIFEKERK